MTTADLARWEALAAAASPGPWSHGLDMTPPDSGIESRGGVCVCHVADHGNVNTIARTGELFSHADAAFIATARKAVPLLCAKLREVAAERDRLKRDVEIRTEEAAQLRKRLYAVCGK